MPFVIITWYLKPHRRTTVGRGQDMLYRVRTLKELIPEWRARKILASEMIFFRVEVGDFVVLGRRPYKVVAIEGKWRVCRKVDLQRRRLGKRRRHVMSRMFDVLYRSSL